MSTFAKSVLAGAGACTLALLLVPSAPAQTAVRRLSLTPALNPNLLTPAGASALIPSAVGFAPSFGQGIYNIGPSSVAGGQFLPRIATAPQIPTLNAPNPYNNYLIAPPLQNPSNFGPTSTPGLIGNTNTFGSPFSGAAGAVLNTGFAGNALFTNPLLSTSGLGANAALSNPYLGAAAGLNSASLSTTGLGAGATNPYSGYENPYYGNIPDPNAGYLHGAADVINAQGRFRLSTTQANLMNQQIEHEKIENRRRWVDEYLYEREHLPTTEDDRERTQRITLQRMLNDPPVNEILSATALNTLLANLEKQTDKNTGANVPIDEDVLRRINVSSPQGGNIGLLRNGPKLNWPVALRSADFQRDRDKIESMLPDALSLAKEGKTDSAAMAEMTNVVDRMQSELSADLRDLTPEQGIEARRFLNNLSSAIRALERPDAGSLLSRDWASRGNSTVADLVRNMKEKGLVFAPSVGGDESAYLALQRALATYSASLSTLQANQGTDKEKPQP